MNRPIVNGTAVAVTLILLFSWAIPAQAQVGAGTDQPAAPAGTSIVPAAAPVITVWYETALRYGQLGNPQTQINILGNVSGATSLTYRLNGGPATSIPLGPDGLRLVNSGDFNAALNVSALVNGSNTLLLTATGGGGTAQKTVTINYTAGRTWPLPYTTNWAAAGSINDQAQVVDGLWSLTAAGVRPVQVGYDRLIAIGDMSWGSYEILVPITINGFTPSATDPTDTGGVGVIARWQGHIGSGPLPTGWTNLGAYAYYSNRNGALALRLNGNNPALASFSYTPGQTYLFKLRAETVGQSGKYSFKIWVKGQPEPSAYTMTATDTAGDLLNGSMLLVAHRANALFGDVSVCPLNLTYPLVINNTGGGTVTSSAGGQTSLACNAGVTLTAKPAPGFVFAGWSGDQASNSASLSFNMTRPMTVTANFLPSGPITYDNSLFLPMISR